MRRPWMMFLWMWSLLPLALAAQDPYFKVIDETDGLPNNTVYDIFQDAKGFIWVATDDGLCRYDGHSFKRFTSSKQSSKPGSNINEDALGRIWYENFDGYLLYVSGDSLVPLDQEKPKGFRRAGFIDGRIYIPNLEALQIYDLTSLTQLPSLRDSASGWGMAGSRGESKFWVYAGKKYNGIDETGQVTTLNTSVSEELADGFPIDYMGSIFEIKPRGDRPGVYRLDNGKWRFFSSLSGGRTVQDHSIGDGKIWICYFLGMEVIDAKTGEHVGNRTFFPDKSITATLVDREGNLWLGSKDEGLMLLPDFSSECILSPGTGLKRLATTPMGLVAGSQTGELLLLNPQTQQWKVLARNNSQHSVDMLFCQGDLLVAGYPEASSWHLPEMRPLEAVPIAIKSAVPVNDRYLGISTSNTSGFWDIAGGMQMAATEWDSIATAHPNSVVPTISDNVVGRGRSVTYVPERQAAYFATSVGLQRLTPHGRREVLHDGRTLYCGRLLSHQSRVFALTTLGELMVLDAQDRVTKVTGLPSEGPYSNIWLIGDHLYVLSPRHLLQIDVQAGRMQVVNMISGLRAGTIHDIAFYQGRLALAADNGLILLDPGRQSMTFQPQLYITDLRVGGKPYPPDSLVTVGHSENDVAISYSILNFRTGGDYPLFYRIGDGAWNKTQPDARELMLAQLSPGDYHIEFCLGAPGCASVATVRVSILRPFWQTTWFTVVVAFVLMAILALVLWQRNRVVALRHAAKLEKLELENALRQSTLTAIRSQMNPHFFFNALNTIQAFIFSDDKRNATNYLGKFSKLARLVLEMSEKEYVSLAEEIEAITLYLELEKSRFGDDFQFQIAVGPGLSLHSMYLPSMIIQPFVENAVKHGLLHQSGQKEVRVSFEFQDPMLIIEVQDNGIGRKRSEEINRTRKDRHQSFSVNANQKRIDILNAGRTEIGVVYVDKSDTGGTATGTDVKITLLPLIKAIT